VALQVRLAGHPCFIELNGGVVVNDEMERICEDVVVAEWREYPGVYLNLLRTTMKSLPNPGLYLYRCANLHGLRQFYKQITMFPVSIS